MSDYGPRIEATDFDFRGHYGDENEVVYSDSELRKLLYVESPAYEITATDVQKHTGEFVEDEITDKILRRVNNDATTTEAIRRLESALLESVMKTLNIMDLDPVTQCTISELSLKIDTREKYLKTLDLRRDHDEVVETKARLRRFNLIKKDRERKIRLFDTHFYNVDRECNNWPLKTAVAGIAAHRAQPKTTQDGGAEAPTIAD